MNRITLIGPGAIGCTLLGHLSCKEENTLEVVARTQFSKIRVDTPQRTIETSIQTLCENTPATGVSDWIFVCVKTYDFESILPWIEKLSGPQTTIAIIQNGVEHLDRLPSQYYLNRTVPVIIDCPVERIAPGHVHQRGDAIMTVPNDESGKRFMNLFENTQTQVYLSDDWKTVAWKKLCINSVGAINAVLNLPAGVFQDLKIQQLAKGAIQEVVGVGIAHGAELDSSEVESVLNKYKNAPKDAVNSLHADCAAGRNMEIDARNGVIVRLGKQYGIPTPYNETLVALLESINKRF